MSDCFLSLNESGYVTIPAPIRERHGLDDLQYVTVQAIGCHLQIAAETDDGGILFRIPLLRWEQTQAYSRSMTRGGVHIDRWRHVLKVEDVEGEVVAPASTIETDHSP